MQLNDSLRAINEEEYGSEYRSHLLEQYKIYLEMADKISERRQTANSFFLSINTALLALIGYTNIGMNELYPFTLFALIGICGLILCYVWYRLNRSYKDLNSGKFRVVHNIEKMLPIKPYSSEWISLGEGKNPTIYLPFTKIEIIIPWIFFVLYALVLFWNAFNFIKLFQCLLI